ALQVVFVLRAFNFTANPRYIIRLISFAAGVITMSYISRLLPIDWRVALGALLLLSALLAFALRLLELRSLFSKLET
ncbi:MAG TPA: hypothetical protein VF298_02240, partial [Bacteroidales bacterium]